MGVYVFLNTDYADWELGFILPELTQTPQGPAVAIKKNIRRVVTFGLDVVPVKSMGALAVAPEKRLAEVDIDQVEALILPGGLFWEKFSNPKLDALVKNLVKRGTLVGGICAATGYLGRLGLLDEIEHTSNSLEFLKNFAPSYKGASHYKTDLSIAHRGIVTASGLGAIDFTYNLLKALEVYEPHVCDVWYRAFKNGEDPFTRKPKLKSPALECATVTARTTSIYPEPFRSRVLPREKRPLGDALGLTKLGINLTTLSPGKESSMRHWHYLEDEFVFVLEGELCLVTDEGEQVLTAGTGAGFRAGEKNGHHLVNLSFRPARYLEISNRDADDMAEYPNVDLACAKSDDGKYVFSHKDGSPY